MVDEAYKPASDRSKPLLNIDDVIAEWSDRSMKWRTEPEISKDRQHRLFALIRTVPPGEDYFPLVLEPLTRADVEWLIANSYHENIKLMERMKQIIAKGELGVRFDLETIRELRQKIFAIVFQAQFIDLRGAILKDVDLSGIPLDGVLL